ncbi:MAG: UDP-N-acetylmuramate--L-alanine ligase, partial [Solobacterium sp.]|nr:UDP-N-acetylmuramate--L-alanine ligase [Solobacterium sp.]
MFQVRYDQPLHIHFIGIGGISMSGLAEILLDRGFTVSGSDMHESDLVAHLRSKGATIFVPQSRDNVIDGIEVVCYTAAIHEDNPEYIACKEKGLPMLSRAELLGELMGNYQEAINIAGTHGKTTTTSMISEILLHAEKDPTISLGGVLDDIGGNVRVGKQDYFVVEACEYTNSFLSFCPTVSVILNVEEDHLDFFKDIEDIRHSFRLFCERTKENGCIIMNQEINQYEELVGSSKAKVITFGFEESADYYAEDIHYDEQANATFTVYEKGNALGKVKLNVPGKHNVSNALASIAVGRYFALDFAIIQKGLAMFGGTHRRFEYKGKYHGFTIIDDYAHHPQEIEAS